MTYSLILFDCDGTLVDSEHLNNLAIVTLIQEFGLSEYTMEHALEHFVGLRFSHIMSNISAETGYVFPNDISKRYLLKVRALAESHMHPIEGASAMVQSAQKHANICVVSNGERNNVLFSLDRVGLSPFFDEEIVFTGMMAKNPKPAPDLFLLAAHHHKTNPEQALVIEDSVAGVQAGCAAGMDVWGFCGTHHAPDAQEEKLHQAGAKRVFRSMHDMKACYESLYNPA